MIYLKLFWAFFKIGLLSVGGGYAAMPLISAEIVTRMHWLTASEFADVVTISEMTPGPIAINAATFVGTRLCGLAGAVVATAGCVLPSCIIVTALARCYQKLIRSDKFSAAMRGLRPAVTGMICASAFQIMEVAFLDPGSGSAGGINLISIGLFIAALSVLRISKANPIWVMLFSGVAGGACFYLAGSV